VVRPHFTRVGEMTALDSCLCGISASLHTITQGWCILRVLATATIVVALVERACARKIHQNQWGLAKRNLWWQTTHLLKMLNLLFR